MPFCGLGIQVSRELKLMVTQGYTQLLCHSYTYYIGFPFSYASALYLIMCGLLDPIEGWGSSNRWLRVNLSPAQQMWLLQATLGLDVLVTEQNSLYPKLESATKVIGMGGALWLCFLKTVV